MRVFVLSLLAGLVSILPVLASEDYVYDNAAFSMQVLDGVKCEKVPGPDFTVYSFVQNKTELIAIYVGHAPNFPDFPHGDPKLSSEKINGRVVKVATIESPDHKISKQYLFDRSGDNDKGPELHVWYNNLSGNKLLEVEKSIHSIILKPRT